MSLWQYNYWKLILLQSIFIGFVNGYYSCPGPSLFLKRHIEYCFPLNLSSGFIEDSVIVGNNKNHLTSLRNWLVPVEQSSTSVWKGCWRASVDGWASSTFHSRCDGKGPTVTIIRVGIHIFWGYTSLPWGTLIMKSEITLLQLLLSCMRLRKYRKMDKNYWNKFAKITHAQLLRFFPTPWSKTTSDTSIRNFSRISTFASSWIGRTARMKGILPGYGLLILLKEVLFWGHKKLQIFTSISSLS